MGLNSCIMPAYKEQIRGVDRTGQDTHAHFPFPGLWERTLLNRQHLYRLPIVIEADRFHLSILLSVCLLVAHDGCITKELSPRQANLQQRCPTLQHSTVGFAWNARRQEEPAEQSKPRAFRRSQTIMAEHGTTVT